ncbi:MAG: S41 family peptidase [Actinomycetes bacterium]
MTDGYLRFPSLCGDHVAFTAEDDVWLAPVEGGRGWRLTADRAPVADVRVSPDGRHVAFLSSRDGVPEVHVVPTDGGPSRRLTWWGHAYTRVLGWLPDGRVAAASAHDQAFRSRSWARAVPLDGGPAEVLPYGPVTALARASGGATAVGTGFNGRRRDYAWWKRYRGGTASRLWVDADGSGDFTRLLPEVSAQLVAPTWVGDRLAFLSDDEGHGNVYSCRADGGDLRRHTDHEGFYARQLTGDGRRRLVYARAGELWLLETLDAAPRRLGVRTGGPASGRTPHPVPASRHLGDVAPDRTGRASAVEVRGTVHWVTHRDGPVRALAAEPGTRARLPRVGGDVVAWVSDATGEDAVVVRRGGEPPRTLAAGRLGRVLALAVAPDGASAAVATHDGRLVLLDLDSGADRLIDRTANDAPADLSFSPDSAWLAWTHPGPEPLSQIRLARLADDTVVEATPMRFTDSEPVFTPDGRYLAFLARRTFDPVYDEHVFDLSFPAGTRPYLLPLAATTPSPFDPSAQGRPASPEKPTPPENVTTAVDVEHLADRVVPVPVPAARYASLRATADGLVWLHLPLRGELGEDLARPGGEPPRPTLERVDLAHGRLTVLAENVDAVEVSGDGTHLVVRDGDALRVVPADRAVKGDDDPDARVEVDLDRVRVVVDPPAEWRQMLDEAGRLMRDHFWVPDMAGVDWDGVLERYRPLLDRIGSRDDLSDVIWEVHGELGTSHAYETPPERPVEAARRVGLLGADLAPDADGTWRVRHVLPGESSAGQARSPLLAPGVGVGPGDAVLEVDGRPVDPVGGPGPLLVGTAGRPVELLVRPEGGEPRRVVVVPVPDETPLRYHAWVAGRRAAVRAATGGRAGYLHVPDMVATGWAQLHRDLRTEMARDALVLDVRENGGGHTSELVVEKVARRVIAWQLGRGWEPVTYPTDARRGPMVCVTNENAGSDGDIVTAAVKALGLGPVVGTRTWGGVIGIDGRYTLVDGTSVTQPRYGFWFDSVGWDVENHGVDPDVEVPVPPQAWAAGKDPQLDTAVRMLVEALEAQGAATPPDVATRPSRVPPPLPSRDR